MDSGVKKALDPGSAIPYRHWRRRRWWPRRCCWRPRPRACPGRRACRPWAGWGSCSHVTCRCCTSRSGSPASSTRSCPTGNLCRFKAVLWIRIRIWIYMFLGLLDPGQDPLVGGMDPDPDPSIKMQK
jgi:hypothetical protein